LFSAPFAERSAQLVERRLLDLADARGADAERLAISSSSFPRRSRAAAPSRRARERADAGCDGVLEARPFQRLVGAFLDSANHIEWSE
jgi:hypothetical protein